MNISKFTQKSVEAVQNCEKLAYEYGNQQIDQEHLLVSLLKLEDSLIMKLVTKMGISGGQFLNEAEQALNKLPKVSGGGQVYLSNDLNKVLISAEDEAKAMGDEYVSVEHLFRRSCFGLTGSTGINSFRRCPPSAAISGWSAITRRRRMIL